MELNDIINKAINLWGLATKLLHEAHIVQTGQPLYVVKLKIHEEFQNYLDDHVLTRLVFLQI